MALERCRDKPEYMVAVVFNSPDRKRQFLESCRDCGVPFRVNVRKGTIVWKNGSVIRAYTDYQITKHDYEYNQIILDGDFNQNWINKNLEPLLIPYEQDSIALDEFLEEFAIQEGEQT